MERNRTILDKQEFYLYFCDITFNNAKYPIFYIPFSVNKQGDALNIEFDSQVYINKKALEYIAQEYNRETNNHGNLQSITDRIIYLAQYKENFGELIDGVMNGIANFFKLDKKIDIRNAEYQISKSFWVKASNARYVALFDKSDEALANDYEEILKLLASNDSILAGAFNGCLFLGMIISPHFFPLMLRTCVRVSRHNSRFCIYFLYHFIFDHY